MKKTCSSLLALLLLAASCNKGDDPGNGGTTAAGQLLPASSGWQLVSSVRYRNSVSGEPGEDAMTPYDLTMVGNKLALLYSDDYMMGGVRRHVIMKMMLDNGTVDADANATELRYDRGGSALQIHRFVPGTYTTVSGQFQNNEMLVYSEVSGPIAAQHFGSINALPALRWYADGTILAGMKDGPHASAYWDYQFPAIGSFNYVVNQWLADSVSNILASPMKLSDGQVLDLVLSKTNNAVYFSVLRNQGPAQPGTAGNFAIVCRNGVPELDPAKQYSMVTSDVQGDAQTFLIAEVNYTSGDAVYERLHAFRWKKGATALEALYNVPINDKDLGRDIMMLTTNTSFPNEVRLTPDGTAYFLSKYAPQQGNGTSPYTALTLINQNGIRQLGKVLQTEAEKNKRLQYELHCCRYFNGAYYAIVHPTDDFDFNKYAPEFRLELVKITP